MKKVLVTGAAGMIGYHVLEYLLKESKYEITALDLKSSKSERKLKKFAKKINIVYGDINDEILISSLVKSHDFIIHLADILPPLADVKSELTNIISFEGTKNIVDAIKAYNQDCYLFFSSSTSVYGNRPSNPYIKVGDTLNPISSDYYSNSKIKAENYIISNLINYTIFRLSAIMGKKVTDSIIYHIPLNAKLEISSDLDAALAFVKAIENKDKLKEKIFNLGGGTRCRTTCREFLARMLKTYGLDFNSIGSMIFSEKKFNCGYYEDSDKLENILHYRRDTLDTYFSRISRESNKWQRFLAKILSKPIVYILNKKNKN